MVVVVREMKVGGHEGGKEGVGGRKVKLGGSFVFVVSIMDEVPTPVSFDLPWCKNTLVSARVENTKDKKDYYNKRRSDVCKLHHSCNNTLWLFSFERTTIPFSLEHPTCYVFRRQYFQKRGFEGPQNTMVQLTCP